MALSVRGPQHFKICLLGDTGVGKSCVLVRFTRDEFDGDVEPTIGAAFLSQTVETEGGQMVKLEVWDTAGQERYKSLAPMYYRSAHGAIVVFDLTSAESFEASKMWVKELHRRADKHIVIALCGNKLDLAAERREVDRETALAFAQSEDLMYMETSARSGEGVQELFHLMAVKLPEKHRERHDPQDAAFPVASTQPAPPPSDSCC